ncbi:hypothetical protein [Solimonas flava]|uniref:hypothetical protein n=1 Tax=Solimonas flava TaxID=415849 RepID=UPI0004820D3D|nr:hypothetical protein [Solimonas flava]
MGDYSTRSLLRGLTPQQLRERAAHAQHQQRAAALNAIEQLRKADDYGAEALALMTLAVVTERANHKQLPPSGRTPAAGQLPGGDGRRGLLNSERKP